MDTIAERLVSLRRRQGFEGTKVFFDISQHYFATSGITEELMLQFESGIRLPSRDQVHDLKKAYGGSVDWILTGQGDIDLQP